ncbi:FAD-dependent oxidoreductase (plasmid) [Streptomycetaceae bacterium NBC_01309]
MIGTHSAETQIVVIGGGIGGLTTALALARSGYSVKVLERAEDYSEIGAGLQLAPNATRILDRLGVLEAVEKAGVRPDRLVLGDARTGVELASLDLGEAFLRRYRAPYVLVHRSDLLAVLLDACRSSGVVTETRRQVTRIESNGRGATAWCADGSHHAGRAVVAADGLWSTARQLVSDDEPICSGYVAYRGTVSTGELPDGHDLDAVVAWIGPGLHLVEYPLRGKQIYNQVAVFKSDRYTAGESEWGTPDELDERFAAMCDRVRAGAGRLWRDRRWVMYDRAPAGNWVSGNVALLGDAAHPVLQYLAQGACQAMEDAVVLTEHINRATTAQAPDLGATLRAYQAERMDRTTRVQRSARLWGDTWHFDGAAAMVRNELLRTHRSDDYGRLDWLYGTDVR